ncbi:MAG TPA: hypothetical protein VFR50_01350 [Casimicrobiaceae bacterium]|nr:hypothetical protein [Casimicrobiaceae bacterium]
MGSFYMLPANTTHYAWSAPKGVTLQVHSMGPSGMTMIDSAKK